MSNRSIGVRNAPGTTVIEREQALGVQGGQLGSVGYVGVLERGDLQEGDLHGGLIGPLNSASFSRVCGGRIKDSVLPAICQDFFRHSNGNGDMFLVRLGDGTQTVSELVLAGRNGSDPGQTPQYMEDMLRITTKNCGTWGGKRRFDFGQIDDGGDLSAIYIDTDRPYAGDFWKGAELKITDDTTGDVVTYEVTGNDTSGNIFVGSDHSILNDFSGFATTLTWELSLYNKSKRLSIDVKDGAINPTSEFGIVVRDNGNIVKTWDDLSMDPDSDNYVVPTINDDPTNYYIMVEDLWLGGEITQWSRPASWCGYAHTATPTGLKVWPVQYKIQSPTGANGTVGGFVWGDELVRDTLKIVFADATNYGVTSDRFGLLGTGTTDTLFTYNNRFGIQFVVLAGTEDFVLNDRIDVRISPFEMENTKLIGGKVFVNSQVFPNRSVAVKDNTIDTLNGRISGDFTANMVLPVSASITGTEVGTGPNHTFTVTLGTNDVLSLRVDNGLLQTYTITANVDIPLSDIVDELNLNFNGVTFSADNGSLKVTSNSGGALSVVTIGSSNANALFGFTDDDVALGFDSTLLRVEGPFELEEGSDGIYDIDESNFELAFDVDTSPFNDIEGMGQGLVKFATPGWSDPDIQNHGATYAASKQYTFQYEIPATVMDEVEASDWCDAFAQKDGFSVTFWPSYAYVPNPDGRGKVLRSLTGQIQGIQARRANEFGGYHGVGAGLTAVLPNVISFGDRASGRNVTERPDMEYLNPRGINSFKKIGNQYHVWGARTLANNSLWRFAHVRYLMSHYERVLLESFDWALFNPNDSSLWSDVISVLSDYFSAERRKGALFGETDADAFFIKVDSENNTDGTMNNGELNAYIELRLPNIVERVIISVGRMGIRESVS